MPALTVPLDAEPVGTVRASTLPERIEETLSASVVHGLGTADAASDALRRLVAGDLDKLPLPGQGSTLARWQALFSVARQDLSLVKLYEGHTDALSIMAELGAAHVAGRQQAWGTWAAEAPDGRVFIDTLPDGSIALRGRKCWCSGAAHVDSGLLTAWFADGSGPQLVAVAMNDPAVTVDTGSWRAVGMAGSSSVDVMFDGATAKAIGGVGDYLRRPGFWQGGAGIAACWLGGATGLADKLRARAGASQARSSPYVDAALGQVDVALAAAMALLRETAAWIDRHPDADAMVPAMRARLAVEATCERVMALVGRALGAVPYCKDEGFARLAADLPVFLRQSHADQDAAALARALSHEEHHRWML